jgi:glucose uptake protein
MYIVQSYPVAVALTFITMLCWGSWANSQKIAAKNWRFELFYWDYVIGILLLALLFGFTLGSNGSQGMSFTQSIAQADIQSILQALAGGAIFNLANILVVAAIATAGMAIAFPVGIGLCMVLGVTINYIFKPKGDPLTLFLGVALVALAIIVDAIAYRKLSASRQINPTRGLILALSGGFLMAWFFRFVSASIATNPLAPEPGKMTPYAAFMFFAIGIFLSNLLFNTYLMRKPVSGTPVSFKQYFGGDTKSHLAGIFGGMIWAVGTSLSLIAATKAGDAISFGLGQGATMVGALWGVFIWKEFQNAPKGVNKWLIAMFLLFAMGLGLIIYSGL